MRKFSIILLIIISSIVGCISEDGDKKVDEIKNPDPKNNLYIKVGETRDLSSLNDLKDPIYNNLTPELVSVNQDGMMEGLKKGIAEVEVSSDEYSKKIYFNIISKSIQEHSNLHVKSPKWQDQIIYFVVTDRFSDGDKTNNDFGHGLYTKEEKTYNGGDFQGIINKMDYIKNLGATALWITPPVANQWYDPFLDETGYHGYWAENLLEVDKHYGTLDDYKNLANTLHDNNMYLIQDIVPNHFGTFTYYEGGEFNPDDPSENLMENIGSIPEKPTQYPFNFHSYNDSYARDLGAFHWTGPITDHTDLSQLTTNQMGEIDDVNTENPFIIDVLKQSYGYWIKEVGIDGFRIDTVKYIDHPFWNDFLHAEDGIHNIAQKSGKEDFLVFGEVFGSSDPYDDTFDKFMTSYLGTPDKPELSAVLQFALHNEMRFVFGAGQPTKQLEYRLNKFMDSSLYHDPYITPQFVDNHDVSRFLQKYSKDGLKQSFMFTMTIPGIPIIYYGTEQEFTVQRGAMFEEGYKSGGQDHYNQESEMYKYISELSEIRKNNKVFTRGTIDVLKSNESGAGAFVYKREYEGEKAFVIFNTSGNKTLISDLDTGLKKGQKLKVISSIKEKEDLIVGNKGKLTMELAKRSGMILMPSDEILEVPDEDQIDIIFNTKLEGEVFNDNFTIEGAYMGEVEDLKVIIDGNLDQMIDVELNTSSRTWKTEIQTTLFPIGETNHTIAIYEPVKKIVTDSYSIITKNEGGIEVEYIDPQGDHKGPEGKYIIPTESSYNTQMDIRKVNATVSGGNLTIKLEMDNITNDWDPSLGFDHVLFFIFIDLNNNEGSNVLPMINYGSPEGFSWDYLNFVEGWNNTVYSSIGSSSDNYGTPASPSPILNVNKENKTIELFYSKETFGNPEDLLGTKIFITTWDFDGATDSLRPLSQEGGEHEIGGGNPDEDPYIYDMTDVIEINE
ncbi:MAG: alpha-amylase family glycosyl hydrolase [Fusobacteriota bacterium]